MDRVDFTLEQKQQMLVGIDRFFELYGNYFEDEQTHKLIAICLWDNDSFQIPPLYENNALEEDGVIPLKNDFESKYHLMKAVIKVNSGQRKPLGYGILLNYYVNLFHSILLKLNSLQDGTAAAIKHVISPQFLNDEKLKDYIYQDFDGLGNGLIKVSSIYIHPLWSAYMFCEEVVFAEELDSFQRA